MEWSRRAWTGSPVLAPTHLAVPLRVLRSTSQHPRSSAQEVIPSASATPPPGARREGPLLGLRGRGLRRQVRALCTAPRAAAAPAPLGERRGARSLISRATSSVAGACT